MPGVFYVPESVMAIVAHPDDIEFSYAGTLARWVKAGARISYILLTSGDVGIEDPEMTRAQVSKLREAETREAARIVGAQEVVFMREPDGLLQPTLELRKKLVREIRRFRPEVILAGDPTVVWAGPNYINHPDHRAAATAALDAAFPAAGQPHVFQELEEEGLQAHKPRRIYVNVWENNADLFVSIDQTIEIKIEALKAHKSQMRDWDPGPMIREWAAGAAKGKEMEYAEAFRVVTLINDETWEKQLLKQQNGKTQAAAVENTAA
jgi:LmbE family N-acetylglucosaminyl deacetylase